MIPTSPPRFGSHPQAPNADTNSGRSLITENGTHRYAVALWLCLCANPHQHSSSGPIAAVLSPQSAHRNTGFPPGVMPARDTQRRIRPPHRLHKWSSNTHVIFAMFVSLALRSNISFQATLRKKPRKAPELHRYASNQRLLHRRRFMPWRQAPRASPFTFRPALHVSAPSSLLALPATLADPRAAKHPAMSLASHRIPP